MTIPKGLSEKISKEDASGKIGCLTDEADVSRMPHINIWDTYYNDEMHTLTSFYLHATNDV